MWVVGGAVRDLLLDRAPRELDLVVEGDAVAGRPAGGGAARRRGRSSTTASGPRRCARADVAFDLAGARRETYARPGALPDVELGASLEEDLARRDFTVNTLALRLADGALTGWPGAERGPRRGRCCACSTTARSATTRRGCCGWRATRHGSASQPEPRTGALAAAAVTGGALGDGDRRAARRGAAAAGPRAAAGGAARARALGARRGAAAGLRASTRRSLERALALCPHDVRADLIALASAVRGADRTRSRRGLRALALPGGRGRGARRRRRRSTRRRRARRRRPSEADAVLAPHCRSRPPWSPPRPGRPARATGSSAAATPGWRSAATTCSPPGCPARRSAARCRAARAALLDGAAPDRDAQLAAALAAT